jgi:hypothetical protein
MKITVARERKGDIGVKVALIRDGDLFKAGVTIYNLGSQPFPVEQSRVFLLNAFDRELYRFADYEVKAGWSRLLHMPSPPPPPPRRYYTIKPETPGHYTIQEIGNGYYTVSGYKPSHKCLNKIKQQAR